MAPTAVYAVLLTILGIKPVNYEVSECRQVIWILVGFINLRLTACYYPAVIVALGFVCARKSEHLLPWIGVAIVGQVALFVIGIYG